MLNEYDCYMKVLILYPFLWLKLAEIIKKHVEISNMFIHTLQHQSQVMWHGGRKHKNT
jgi:hypothetical protein